MKNPNKILSSALIVFFIYAINFSTNNGLRILGLFPFQIKSHFVMCEELMRGLAAKGHKVDVYSHFPLAKPIPNYTDFSLKGTLPMLLNNLKYDEIVQIKSVVSFLVNMLSGTMKPMCELLEKPIFQKLLKEPPLDPPYDLIVLEVRLREKIYNIGTFI